MKNQEKCKKDCKCKIEGKTHSFNDGCGCPKHNGEQFEEQTKENWGMEEKFKIWLETRDDDFELDMWDFRILQDFINSLLKEERELGRSDMKEEYEEKRFSELKECPQCHTMKAFSTNICYRCLDRAEAMREGKEEVKKMIGEAPQNGTNDFKNGFNECKENLLKDLLEKI